MKKLNKKQVLGLVACALALTAAPAFAEDEGHGRKGGMFQKHDTNGDGTVSKSEFLSHAEERFSKIDSDGSGDISKEEAKSASKEMHGKMKERKAERKERREERQESE